MPAQTSTSPLAAKFDKRKGKQKPLDTGGGGGWPHGIENGVAEIVSIKVGKFAPNATMAGEHYFMIRGMCRYPTTHDGIPVEGLQDTLLLEPLCDTPTRKRKTQDEHVDHMISALEDLGLDTSKLSWNDLIGGSVFNAMLANDAPSLYARFRTWKGDPTPEFPNPRTNVQYGGKCAYEGNGQAAPAVVDQTAEAEAASYDEPTPEEESAPFDSEDADLMELGRAADEGDETAQQKLNGQAKLFNVDADAAPTWLDVAKQIVDKSKDDKPSAPPEDEVSLQDLGTMADEDEDEDAQAKITAAGVKYGVEDTFETWTEWADAIAKARAEQEAGDVDQPFEPVKTRVYFYKPPRAKKSVECECTAVFSGRETCNLKNLDTGAVYKAVKWEQVRLEA